ncbi:MAG TPA: GNAT family N-acetyltransferase, partial [Armatimonadota bacterium]
MTHIAIENLVVDAYPWQGEIPAPARAAWERLWRTTQRPIFNTPEWCEAAKRTALIRPWRVVVIRDSHRVLGVLPLLLRTPWTAELCQPMAEDHPPLLIDPAAEDAVWGALIDWLRERAGIGLLSLGRWREAERIARFLYLARERGAWGYARRMEPDFWVALPATWEAFLAGLGQHTRRNFHRREAQLRRDFSRVSIEVLTDWAAAEQALEEMIFLHRRRWLGQRGSYFDDPHRTRFYRRTLRWAFEQGYAALPILRVRGRTITLATAFHIPGQREAYYHCLARDLDALPDLYSPGTVLLAHTLRWVIDRGACAFSLGIGTGYYKSLVGGQEYARSEVFLA